MSDPADDAAITELLGRTPAGRYEVVLRTERGEPVVIGNAPLLDDGTPMPTRYWLVGREASLAVARLEADGGVRAAQAAVDPDELAAAHARYAAERDAALPADAYPRPSGGVGGTRTGVKCLHAHYAWHLAGGDDPVGRWVAARLDAPSKLWVRIERDLIAIGGGDWSRTLAVNSRALDVALQSIDPPAAADLTNAIGEVTDAFDDLIREHTDVANVEAVRFGGAEAWHLAKVEQGRADIDDGLTISRDELEDLFRTLVGERRADRLHNPALEPERVDAVVATCCVVIAALRRLRVAAATFHPFVPAPLP